MQKHRWTDKEVAEFRRQHDGYLYFNPKDSNMFVPKAVGRGSATNWANPLCWILITGLISACVYLWFFVK